MLAALEGHGEPAWRRSRSGGIIAWYLSVWDPRSSASARWPRGLYWKSIPAGDQLGGLVFFFFAAGVFVIASGSRWRWQDSSADPEASRGVA